MHRLGSSNGYSDPNGNHHTVKHTVHHDTSELQGTNGIHFDQNEENDFTFQIAQELISVFIIDSTEKKTIRMKDLKTRTVKELFECICQKLSLPFKYWYLFGLCTLCNEESEQNGRKREQLVGGESIVEMWLPFNDLLKNTPIFNSCTNEKIDKNQVAHNCNSTNLYFRMKYYLRLRIDGFTCNITKELIYKQLHRMILDSKFPVRQHEAANLGALSLQKQFGNYSTQKFKKGFLEMLIQSGELLPLKNDNFTVQREESNDSQINHDSNTSRRRSITPKQWSDKLFHIGKRSSTKINEMATPSDFAVNRQRNGSLLSSRKASHSGTSEVTISNQEWERRLINIWSVKYSNEISKSRAQKLYSEVVINNLSTYGMLFLDDIGVHNASYKSYLVGIADDGVYLFQNHDYCILKEVYLFESCPTVKSFSGPNFLVNTKIYLNILSDWKEGIHGLQLNNQFGKSIELTMCDNRKRQICNLLDGYYALHIQTLKESSREIFSTLKHVPKRHECLLDESYSFQENFVSSSIYQLQFVRFNRFNRFTRQLEYARSTYSQNSVQIGEISLFSRAIETCLDMDIAMEVLDLRDESMTDRQFQSIVNTILDSIVYCESNHVKLDIQLTKLYISAESLTRNSIPYIADLTDNSPNITDIYIQNFKGLGNSVARVAGSFSQLRSLQNLQLKNCEIEASQEVILSHNLVNVLIDVMNADD